MIDGGSTAQNWLDFRPERAVTGAPQSLNIAFNYSTGQGRMGGALLSGWKGVIFKDWGIGTTISMTYRLVPDGHGRRRQRGHQGRQ